MITNSGKNILAKYLVGQTPSYASHIAVGCGPKPIASDAALPYYSDKTSLDFEMFRVPIISRGFVNEDGQSKIVLTAELPTTERYEITEVGVYSAASNPTAGITDSRGLYLFSESEDWKYGSQASEIISIYEPLDDKFVKITNATVSGATVTYTTDIAHGLAVGTTISVSEIKPAQFNLSNKLITTVPTPTSFTLDITGSLFTGTFTASGYLSNDVETNIINQAYPVFQTNADNKIFTNDLRVARYERCRFLNNIVAISGNNSTITKDSQGILTANPSSNFIQLSDTSINLSKNAPTDELRLAFSLVNKIGNAVTIPDEVRIIVEFSSTGTFKTGKWATFEGVITNVATSGATNNFATNRYFVMKKQLQELQKSTDFAWSEIDTVRIYACVIKDGVPNPDFYVCLDGLRLENTTSINSVYGLTGYSVIKNTLAKTVIKSANTTSYIEFRFALDVV